MPDFMSTVLELLGAVDEDRRSILDSPLPFEAFVEVLQRILGHLSLAVDF